MAKKKSQTKKKTTSAKKENWFSFKLKDSEEGKAVYCVYDFTSKNILVFASLKDAKDEGDYYELGNNQDNYYMEKIDYDAEKKYINFHNDKHGEMGFSSFKSLADLVESFNPEKDSNFKKYFSEDKSFKMFQKELLSKKEGHWDFEDGSLDVSWIQWQKLPNIEILSSKIKELRLLEQKLKDLLSSQIELQYSLDVKECVSLKNKEENLEVLVLPKNEKNESKLVFYKNGKEKSAINASEKTLVLYILMWFHEEKITPIKEEKVIIQNIKNMKIGDTIYLRADRSIERLDENLYEYNDQGLYYRTFDLENLMKFLNDEPYKAIKEWDQKFDKKGNPIYDDDSQKRSFKSLDDLDKQRVVQMVKVFLMPNKTYDIIVKIDDKDIVYSSVEPRETDYLTDIYDAHINKEALKEITDYDSLIEYVGEGNDTNKTYPLNYDLNKIFIENINWYRKDYVFPDDIKIEIIKLKDSDDLIKEIKKLGNFGKAKKKSTKKKSSKAKKK